MKKLAELLEHSVQFHGHLCPGQVLGVRMAMAGCREVGINEPESTRDLIVFVEIDRCATDAIQSVTGCKLGKRTLKFLDYGKMAATFYNVREDTAVRVLARDDSRERAKEYASPDLTIKEAQTQAYMAMEDRELFVITPVQLRLRQEDLPGHPLNRLACDDCGEGVNDRREVTVAGRILCKACAEGAYYLPLETGNGETANDPKPDRPPPVVALVGNSDSGKTRVAASLVESLSGRGYRIAAIKHCPHGHETGRPDSDSDKLYRAGAVAVIASSPDKRSLVVRVGHDSSLTSLVSSIDTPSDLVIAEGFKTSSVPKVLVLDDEQVADSINNIIATVGGDGAASCVPAFAFEDLDRLADLVQEVFLEKPMAIDSGPK